MRPCAGGRHPEGCTVLLCTGSSCCTPLHLHLLAALRETVRATLHGVLVTTGCLIGGVGCRTLPDGPLVLVQPCDVDRHPVGCAMLIGPLQDDVDVAAVGAWLLHGRFDPLLLPARLRTTQNRLSAAARN